MTDLPPVYWRQDTELLVRFLSKISTAEPHECWSWRGGHSGGYGVFSVENSPIRAHVVSLRLFVGDPVGAENMGCHRCHNRACVNPAHLYWGTAADNNADTLRDGNWAPRGLSDRYSAELAEEFAHLVSLGWSQRRIGRRYGCHHQTVSRWLAQPR